MRLTLLARPGVFVVKVVVVGFQKLEKLEKFDAARISTWHTSRVALVTDWV
jgi:hypothetical protein